MLLHKHCKGYESVRDVQDDIETSRVGWVRNVLGIRQLGTMNLVR